MAARERRSEMGHDNGLEPVGSTLDNSAFQKVAISLESFDHFCGSATLNSPEVVDSRLNFINNSRVAVFEIRP